MKAIVVIPNWNGADMLALCLESLRHQSKKSDVLVVDNGSIDNSIELLESQFPEVILIKLPKNTGFAGGVNTGIKYALEKDYNAVALLNNDAIADKKWLSRLIDTLESDNKVGIVTSKILREDKKLLDSTGDFYNAWGTATPRGRDSIDTGQFDKDTDVFGASGGASLYRTELFKDIGLFDEDFFAYYEDIDISFRARLAGWEILYEPSSIVYHKVGATSGTVRGFTTYHSLKNLFFLSYKNLPLSLLIRQFPKRFVYYVALHAYAWLHGKPGSSLRALLQVILLLPRKTAERWRIQRNKKIDTEQLNTYIVQSLPETTKRKLRLK